MSLTKDELSDAILGSFDGLTNVVGLGAGLLNKGSLVFTLFLFCLVNSVGMAGARLISTKKVRLSGVMAIFSFAAGIIPALPFMVFSGTMAVVLASILALGVTGAIGSLKHRLEAQTKPSEAYLQTFGVVLLVCGIAIAASLA